MLPMNAGKKLSGTPEPELYWSGAGGIRLAGDSWGEPSAPLVVLLHGGGQTRHAWKGAGERLATAGYYAVAFDARGHGDSEWSPDGRYDHDIMVEDLERIGVQIDEIARHVKRHQLPQPVPIIDMAGHDAFDEQCAVGQRLAGQRQRCPRAERLDLADRIFENFALLGCQGDSPLVPQKAFGEHYPWVSNVVRPQPVDGVG